MLPRFFIKKICITFGLDGPWATETSWMCWILRTLSKPPSPRGSSTWSSMKYLWLDVSTTTRYTLSNASRIDAFCSTRGRRSGRIGPTMSRQSSWPLSSSRYNRWKKASVFTLFGLHRNLLRVCRKASYMCANHTEWRVSLALYTCAWSISIVASLADADLYASAFGKKFRKPCVLSVRSPCESFPLRTRPTANPSLPEFISINVQDTEYHVPPPPCHPWETPVRVPPRQHWETTMARVSGI